MSDATPFSGANIDVAISSRAKEDGGRLQNVETHLENIEFTKRIDSDEVLDDIVATGIQYTTERYITVALPSGASLLRSRLVAFLTVMNDSANMHKIDIDVQLRPSGGAWSTFFSQDDVIGLPAVEGATTGLVALQDVSTVVTGAGTYGVRIAASQSSANSVHYTTQFRLEVDYKMS